MNWSTTEGSLSAAGDQWSANRLFAASWMMAGGTGLAVSLSPSFPSGRRLVAGALAVATVSVGWVILALARRLTAASTLPLEVLSLLAVTAFGAAAGPFEVEVGLLSVGYALGCGYAAYHLSWRGAALYVGLAAVLYGGLLVETTPAAVAIPRWLTCIGFLTGVVVVLGRIRDSMHGLMEALQRESRTDTLTGVVNRRGFYERAAQELARSARHGEPLALLAIDADHFKQVNDTHGHAAGDAALAALGGLLRRQCRIGDVAARLGGEEFALLLSGTGADHAMEIGERVRSSISRLPGSPSMTVSIGVTHTEGRRGVDVEQLLREADRALYQAKTSGRDRVECATYGADGALAR